MQSINQIIHKFTADPRFQDTYINRIKFVLNYKGVQEFVDHHQEQISQEMIENSLSKLDEYVREDELFHKGELGQNPGFRPQLFINSNYIDLTYIPTKEYYAHQNRRQQRQLLDNRMMSEDVRNAQLKEFFLNTPQRQQLMAVVLDFIEEYKQAPHRVKGLYISGPFGVGKTYLLGALANHMVKNNHSVSMIHYPTFISEIKSKIASNGVMAIIEHVRSVDILIVDDIGAEANTVWVRDEVLTPILEYRMKEELPTFFSSNFNMREIEYHLGHTRDGGDESIKAKRIMERIKYLAKEVTLEGENLRHKS